MVREHRRRPGWWELREGLIASILADSMNPCNQHSLWLSVEKPDLTICGLQLLVRKWIEDLENKMTAEQRASLKDANPEVQMVNAYTDSTGAHRVSGAYTCGLFICWLVS